jgi:hypothetical protein
MTLTALLAHIAGSDGIPALPISSRQMLRIVEWSTSAEVNAGKYAAGWARPANALLTLTPGVQKEYESSMSVFDDIRTRRQTEKFIGRTP